MFWRIFLHLLFSQATMYAEYSDTQLYNQLLFLMNLFDVRRAQARLGPDELTYIRYVLYLALQLAPVPAASL